MIPEIDFYSYLRDLIEQIPEGKMSTSKRLAIALGDQIAASAVSSALQRDDFNEARRKVNAEEAEGISYFSDFRSDKPLRRLAELQRDLAQRVVSEDAYTESGRVAGVDVAYHGDEAFAACVVMDRTLNVFEECTSIVEIRFPYVPGYLMFREAPAIKAVAEMASDLDVLLVNGHGVAHPRGCGLASCVGLEMDIPTIGVARRRLVGNVRERRGGWAPLIYEDEVVGAEVEAGGSKAYVSVGHKISLETSVKIVQKLTAEGRFPEPLRRAHVEASTMVKHER
jgi:deoxyinosine 3'endonuclease (endonuclease V)